MYLLFFGDIPNLVSCAFSTIPIFPPFNSQNFFIYLSLLFFYMLCSIRREHSSRSFAPPQKWLFSMVTRGIKCARTYVRRARAGAEYSSCIIFVDANVITVQSAEHMYSKRTACSNILCLLSMVLKTRGLRTGAILMRGSYIAEPRLLAWLRGRTVLVKSEHEVHHR